jgi:hypothetical protein
VRAFDFLDKGRDRFSLLGREVRLLFFGVDREEVEDGMAFEIEINHARSTAFASARKPHARFAYAAGSLDEIAFLRVVLQLVLKEAVSIIIDQSTESFGETARFNKGQLH